MNILVLGASGLAGSAMMEAFQAEGHNVSGTCRTPTHTALLPFDLDQPQAIVPLLERVRPDVVVSCLRGEFSRQLEAHRLLAEFLSRHHGTLVYLSTANVFDGDLSRPHYEGDPPRPHSAYGQFKAACETLLQALGRKPRHTAPTGDLGPGLSQAPRPDPAAPGRQSRPNL